MSVNHNRTLELLGERAKRQFGLSRLFILTGGCAAICSLWRFFDVRVALPSVNPQRTAATLAIGVLCLTVGYLPGWLNRRRVRHFSKFAVLIALVLTLPALVYATAAYARGFPAPDGESGFWPFTEETRLRLALLYYDSDILLRGW